MDIKTVNKIIKTLKDQGYNVKPIELTENRNGIAVDTNYDGLYPGKYQFDTLAALRKKYKNYTVEQRGHYTAVFIY